MKAKMNIGLRIQEARKASRLTQKELAEMLGISVQAVSQWEQGSAMTARRLPQLARALDVEIDWLLEESDNRPSTELNERKDVLVPIIELAGSLSFSAKTFVTLGEHFMGYVHASSPRSRDAFAIFLSFSSEDGHFKSGDLIIFDKMIQAEDNDVVLAALRWVDPNLGDEGDKLDMTLSLYRLRENPLGDPAGSRRFTYLQLAGEDYTSDEGTKPSGGERFADAAHIATMVEHRSFRESPAEALKLKLRLTKK